jgi:hypothetical protein
VLVLGGTKHVITKCNPTVYCKPNCMACLRRLKTCIVKVTNLMILVLTMTCTLDQNLHMKLGLYELTLVFYIPAILILKTKHRCKLHVQSNFLILKTLFNDIDLEFILDRKKLVNIA